MDKEEGRLQGFCISKVVTGKSIFGLGYTVRLGIVVSTCGLVAPPLLTSPSGPKTKPTPNPPHNPCQRLFLRQSMTSTLTKRTTLLAQTSNTNCTILCFLITTDKLWHKLRLIPDSTWQASGLWSSSVVLTSPRPGISMPQSPGIASLSYHSPLMCST